MKSKIIAVSGILAASFSLPALAQVYAPGWYTVKHPEIRLMDALRAQAAAGGSDRTLAVRPQAAVAAADLGGATDWADLKHPELRTMAKMRAAGAASGHVALHGVVAHHAGMKPAAQTHSS
ncbi:MAG TPA: hypothetical protein VKC56_07410 [Gallionellaceae bacterium]|nr:hypothetical protein [Gallionellaceae bacterium]